MRKPWVDQEIVKGVSASRRRDNIELVLLGSCQIGGEEGSILDVCKIAYVEAVLVDLLYEGADVEVGIGGAEDLEDYLDEVGVDSIALYDEVCGPLKLEGALIEGSSGQLEEDYISNRT
jgi:hypothetical protein